MEMRRQLGPSRLLCALLVISASAGVHAQDMIGPSGDTPSTAPVAEHEAAERLEPDAGVARPAPAGTVGEDAVQPAGLAPAGATSDSADVLDYPAQWQVLTDAGDHAAAIDLAKTWAADAARQYGDGADESFVPLTRLGESYESAAQYVLAARAYEDAIEIAQSKRGVFDMAMIEPLLGLGRVLSARGEYESAVSSLMRAKDITHRNLGIFNAEQAPIVGELTESYVGLGEVRQATREQRFLFGAREKQLGADNPDLVPALQEWATWNARIQRFPDARRIFYRAIEILENAYGPNDLRIVETLNMIARSFYMNADSTYPREGAQALRRAVAIYESQEFVDQADLMRARTKLADWYMISGSRSRAVDAYEDTIATAKAAGVDEDLIEARYGIPRMLRTSSTPIGLWPHEREKLGNETRHVILEYDVDKRGRPRNIRVIEDTVKLVDTLKLLRNRVAATVYRPRFVDGKAVPTFGVRQQFDFTPDEDVATVGTTLPSSADAPPDASP